MIRFVLTFLAVTVFSCAGHAGPVVGIDVEAGAGMLWAPKFEGAKKHEVTAVPLAAFNSFTLPYIGKVGGPENPGLILAPSLGYIAERKASDDVSLAGTKDIDFALEVGGKIGWRFDYLRVFAEARQGFIGHTGIRGKAGADLILAPFNASTGQHSSALTLDIGPRLHFATSDYTKTYFGANAEGGIKGFGAEGTLKFQVTDQWTLVAGASFERLIGGVGDSAIVKAGDVNQTSARLGLTYRLDASYP